MTTLNCVMFLICCVEMLLVLVVWPIIWVLDVKIDSHPSKIAKRLSAILKLKLVRTNRMEVLLSKETENVKHRSHLPQTRATSPLTEPKRFTVWKPLLLKANGLVTFHDVAELRHAKPLKYRIHMCFYMRCETLRRSSCLKSGQFCSLVVIVKLFFRKALAAVLLAYLEMSIVGPRVVNGLTPKPWRIWLLE